MQIVIDIPEEMYKEYVSVNLGRGNGKTITYNLLNAIKNGTPLPKGHGRIGDLDQILMWMIYKKGIIDKLKCGEITPVFKDATIIEAENSIL